LQIIKEKFIIDLSNKLELLDTNENTSRVITQYLGAWLSAQKYPDLKEIVPNASIYLQQAVKEQSELGWEQWFQGRITTTWSELYQHDINNTKTIIRFPSSKRWGKEIIALTYKFVLDVGMSVTNRTTNQTAIWVLTQNCYQLSHKRNKRTSAACDKQRRYDIIKEP
jgi:hypothetical protein